MWGQGRAPRDHRGRHSHRLGLAWGHRAFRHRRPLTPRADVSGDAGVGRCDRDRRSVAAAVSRRHADSSGHCSHGNRTGTIQPHVPAVVRRAALFRSNDVEFDRTRSTTAWSGEALDIARRFMQLHRDHWPAFEGNPKFVRWKRNRPRADSSPLGVQRRNQPYCRIPVPRSSSASRRGSRAGT